MTPAIMLAVTVAIIGLGIGLAIRGRSGGATPQRARRVAIIQSCALLLCSALLTVSAVTTEHLRYLNIPIAVLTVVYGALQLWRLRRRPEAVPRELS